MADFQFTDDMVDSSLFVYTTTGHFAGGIPPWNAGTIKGAQALQSYLASVGITTTIVMDYPQGFAPGSFFVQSGMVPWLVDGKGAKENAGTLIWNYKVLPYSLADSTVRNAFALDDAAAAGQQ